MRNSCSRASSSSSRTITRRAMSMRRAHPASQARQGARRDRRSCAHRAATTAPTARSMPTPASASATMKRRCACIANSSRARPILRTCTCRSRTRSRRWAAGGSDRGLSGRRRGATELRRCVLEPRQPQDLSLHGRGDRGACARRKPPRRTSRIDRFHLCFALGKALEDRRRYAESFALLRARQRAEETADSLSSPRLLERHLRAAGDGVHAASSLRARQGVGCESRDPIFIVGLPRRAPRCSSRFSPRIPRSKGRWSSRTSRGSPMRSAAASRMIREPRYPGVAHRARRRAAARAR